MNFADDIVDLCDVPHKRIFECALLYYLKETNSIVLRIARIESFLRAFLHKIESSASDRILEVNLSERNLRRVFMNHTGVSPKVFASITRFNSCVKELMMSEKKDWIGIVVKHGYYNQSHFIKEFKKYCGQAPASFKSKFETFDRFFRL
ncbi:AraC family transcriptional regulator [Flammeovirgaceae bacterium SG7u.111]|nr:AraC family transcriptional regulator [Flammeovirgaceae bacterium SG7u.132]WPO36364.1 AraC family transcriptional regulator [Flammeovirgaceae bacterium SG7u.111]